MYKIKIVNEFRFHLTNIYCTSLASILVSYWCKKKPTKVYIERKCFKRLTLEFTSLSWRDSRVRTQGRNLAAGTEAEAMEECCLLANLFIWLSQTVPRTTFPHHLLVKEIQQVSLVCWGHFLNWGSFCPNHYGLCQYDTRLVTLRILLNSELTGSF